MANTEATIKDASTSTLVPVEGIAVTSSPSNPSAGQILRQTVAIGDGGGSLNYMIVDTAGNGKTKRVGTGATINAVAVSTSSGNAQAANVNRVDIKFFNNTTANCFIAFASTANMTTAFTFKLSPGQFYEFASVSYSGLITCIFDATGTGNLLVTEVTA